jgi:Transposase IS66 family
LRRQYLQPHEADVEQFFRSLVEKTISSESAEALRTRLTKNRNKLFTFLDYDGVPWNNNNAEHAIKQFAYYRENTIGNLHETGLSDYLVLLSICQICQYKGISFLKFMLSEEKDVDAFSQRKQQRQQLSTIELYPEGFVPQHFMSKYKKKARQEQGVDQTPAPDETQTTSSKPL